MFHSFHHFFLDTVTKLKDRITNFSFGAVSAVITSLALITSLNTNTKSKFGIVGSLLIIAIADNISDAMGIHIHQEGEFSSFQKVWKMTLANFITRLGVVLIFILFVLILSPIKAIIFSIIYGFLILIIVSYLVAKKRNVSPKKIILEHIIITTLVLMLSKYLTHVIYIMFGRFAG